MSKEITFMEDAGEPFLIAQNFGDTDTIRFFTNGNEIIKLCHNGDILVKGKLIENDKELVDALREFLRSQGLLPHPHQQSEPTGETTNTTFKEPEDKTDL